MYRRQGSHLAGRRTLMSLGIALAVIVLTAAGALAAGEYPIPPDQEIGGALFQQFNVDDATGTGLFNPYIRISANLDVVQGYNTDYRPLQFQEDASWTDSLPLSDVPYYLLNGVPYREFQLDINQSGSDTSPTRFLSLDEVQVWLGGPDAATIRGFVREPVATQFGTFPGYTLTPIYNLDAGGDSWLKLDASLSAGSGKRDLRLLIPDSAFGNYGAACKYLGTGCDKYVVFYTELGAHFANNDGFEEWGVAIYSVVSGFKWYDANADGIWQATEEPLEGWKICAQQLEQGAPVGPPICIMTGDDGSYKLPLPNGTYHIYEECPAGWEQSFPATAGGCGTGGYEVTVKNGDLVPNLNFGNYQEVTLKACKLEDVDLVPTTTADRVPVPGWTVQLSKNGVVIDTQVTGADGCYTWTVPALMGMDYYDLHEVVPADWYAWTPTEVDCVAGQNGGACDATFVNSKRPHVTACKLKDVDLDPGTTADRVPVPGWTVKLTKNGTVIDTKTTGPNGCYTWTNLDPLVDPDYYDIHEVVPADWFAWTPTEVDCVAGVNGGACDATFVNSKRPSVKACKLEDVDTNPATAADRVPVKDWEVCLTKNGVQQGDCMLTGADGCYTWANLEPLVAPNYYDVHEIVPAGWFAWTPTDVNCTAGVNGGACDATFVNSKKVNVKICKLEDVDTNPATAADRVPVKGWDVCLTKNGVQQGDCKQTGDDGCYTWTGLDPLAPPNYYDAHEVVPDDWFAWTATDIICDPIPSGGTCTATFVNSKKVYVKACKWEDVDADPATGADRIPVEGWEVCLTKNDVQQGDCMKTGTNGCYTWGPLNPLAPPNYYDVHEVVPDDWFAWTPIDVICTPIASGGTCTANFVNSERVKVTACKLEDMDGDLMTTDDQSSVPMWPVCLSVEGVRTDCQVTGSQGCYTWEYLEPGKVYDVEEDLLPGWLALTPTHYVFDRSVSGSVFSYTFINYQPKGCTYTQGYWKTHSKYGPAGPYDPTWDLKDGGDAKFLSDAWYTGFTWYSILWEPPKQGNAYLILAHQYVAAWLNDNNVDPEKNASTTMLGTALADAEALLGMYTPAYDFKADPDGVRDEFIMLAGILGDFNEGMLGVPHCE